MIKSTNVKEKFGSKKQSLRNELLPKFPLKNVIGLAGRSIISCVKQYLDNGFQYVEVWEHDSKVLVHQWEKLANTEQYRPNFLILGDILDASVKEDTLYDLDFCAHIDSVSEHIKKFRDNFIITVSEMFVEKFSSVTKFFAYRDEYIIVSHEVTRERRYIRSSGGEYLFISYKDTSLMLMIIKLSNVYPTADRQTTQA